MKSLLTFLATFALGAAIALAVRTARHDPHAADSHTDPHAGHHHAAPAQPPLTTPVPVAPTPPAATPTAAPTSPSPTPNTTASPPATAATTPVNTLCAICGMKVDPALPTATYQGKTIAFGCRMCPPKFKADPEKYGPLYLRNEVLRR